MGIRTAPYGSGLLKALLGSSSSKQPDRGTAQNNSLRPAPAQLGQQGAL